jgi:hypothetical protein
MKRFQLLVFLGLFSLAAAQKPIVYKDNAKNPRLIIQGNQGFFVPGESFEISGSVQIKQMSTDGTKVETLMTCTKASGNLTKVKDKVEVDQVRLTGGISFTQKGENSSTTASGDSAKYDLNGELREVTVEGDVKISFDGNSKKVLTNADGQKVQSKVSSTMTTTSRSATLVFKTTTSDKKVQIAELQSAVIRGPIQFNGSQLDSGSPGAKLQKVFAKADKMTYTNSGESKNPEVRLEGNLEFRRLDGADEGASVEGATLLILQLNDKNEITKLRFKADTGQQVKTTISKVDSKGKRGGA